MAKRKLLAAKQSLHMAVAARADAARKSVNWDSYFAHIKSVCPWSSKPWREGRIEIGVWAGVVSPLGSLETRIHVCSRNRRRLKKLCERLNASHPSYEWMWSEPAYGEYAAPVPCLIQQDKAKLENIRQKMNYENFN